MVSNIYRHIYIYACIFKYSPVGYRSDKTVFTFLLLYVYVNVCIYMTNGT